MDIKRAKNNFLNATMIGLGALVILGAVTVPFIEPEDPVTYAKRQARYAEMRTEYEWRNNPERERNVCRYLDATRRTGEATACWMKLED